jgi:hypothetical protein
MNCVRSSAALVLLLVAACSDDNSNVAGPAPPPPPPPPPATQPVVTSVTGYFGLCLSPDSGRQPKEVKVHLDGVRQFSGPMNRDQFGEVCVARGPLYSVRRSGIAVGVGRHKLRLSMTRPGASPDQYELRGFFGLEWRFSNGEVRGRSVGDWRQSLTLATGDTWTGTFDVTTLEPPPSTQ